MCGINSVSGADKIDQTRGSTGYPLCLVTGDLDADNSVAQSDSVWSPEIVVIRNVEINSGVNSGRRDSHEGVQIHQGEFNLPGLARKLSSKYQYTNIEEATWVTKQSFIAS